MATFHEFLNSQIEDEFNVILPHVGKVRVKIRKLNSDYAVLESVDTGVKFYLHESAIIIAA